MKIEENNTSSPIPQAVLASFFGYRQFFCLLLLLLSWGEFHWVLKGWDVEMQGWCILDQRMASQVDPNSNPRNSWLWYLTWQRGVKRQKCSEWIKRRDPIISCLQEADLSMHVCSVAQRRPALCDPMDCSPPGGGCRFLLPGIFPIQGSNLHLLHSQADSLSMSHLGSANNTFIFRYFESSKYLNQRI